MAIPFISHRYIILLLIFLSCMQAYEQNNPTIVMIGSGYVGLVSGPGLAEIGNKVICADVDTHKIAMLEQGKLPIYEPGLEKVIAQNVAAEKLSFTADVGKAIEKANVVFIAVGTPMGEDGSADLSYVKAVAELIAQHITSYKVICTKSTVPVGTGAWIRSLLESHGVKPELFDIVSNPEFLREGSAVDDFLKPDRVVIGTETDKAREIMYNIYKPMFDAGAPYIFTTVPSSEMIKYASNGFLAVKISYINEIANLCDATGADVKTVSKAMGLDKRICPYFLNPGPGFGGSCFPKDSQALMYASEKYQVPLEVVKASLATNALQKKVPFKKLCALMHKDLQGKTIAILGLAYKGNTDDIRYSPSINVIKELLESGAQIKTFDPQAMENMKAIFSPYTHAITYCTDAYTACTGADAVMIMTEWNEFKILDLCKIASLVNNKILVDARNIIDIKELKKLGFAFDAIGRSCMCA